MSLTSISVRQPVLINMICILIIVGGFFCYQNMARERFPNISIDKISVTTVMEGASPKEIEQLITIPLEEEIAKVDEIDEMTSISSDGLSQIIIDLEEGVDNVFEKVTEVQNQIEKVEQFPIEAEDPDVEEMKIPWDTVTVCLLGNAPEHEMKAFADDLKDELKRIPGVEEIDVAGLREREIWIEAEPNRLNSYALSLQDVIRALRGRNLNLPGGRIKMGRDEFNVRTEAEYENIDQILDTIVKEDGELGYVYLRDVARVSNTFEERRSLARLDGQPSINITVRKDKHSNAIRIVERVRRIVERFRPLRPAGAWIELVNDSSREIKNRLHSLYRSFGLGLFLVILSFTAFIGWRPAIMVALGLPVAMFTTFIFLHAHGYSVNNMVLFSMILVLGLLVDDAIVVCENVYRHLEEGWELREAVIRGTQEITWPVVATVLTTVAAFLPLLLMKGVLGKFMSLIPVTVTLALFASLLECLFILPSHIAEWGGQPDQGVKHRKRRWMEAVINLYRKSIAIFLRRRYLLVAVTIGVAIYAVQVARGMDFILFGGRDLESFAMALEAPSGASFEETRRILDELESQTMKVKRHSPEIEHLRARVGAITGPSGGYRGVNLGQISIELVDMNERERTGQEIKDEIREAVKDVPGARAITFEDTRAGPPVGKPIQVRIKGDNFQTLREIAELVKVYLRSIDGVKDIKDNFPPGKDEVRPVLDLEKMRMMGLNVRAVATEIRGAFEGIEATTIRDADEEIELMVKYNQDHRSSLTDMRDMYFSTPTGMAVFGSIAKMERRQGFSQISHHDQKRAINVLADVVEGRANSQDVNKKLMEHFARIEERYPGYTLEFGGEFEDTQDSLNSMIQAFILTAILIYVILGGLFQSFLQPLIVMFAVPFAFVGVVFGFYVTNQPLGMFSIVGILALCGIVVNDSLIFIDFINTRRREGIGRRDSIVEAGSARFRPIILTSITTIAGLMPMTLGLFGVDNFLRPMAMAIAWGLTFSTILTLVVIPCVYCIFDDLSMLALRRPLGLTRKQWKEIKGLSPSTIAPIDGIRSLRT